MPAAANPFSLPSTISLKSFIFKTLTHLHSYTANNLIRHGTALHCRLIKFGISSHNFVAVKLLLMYLHARTPFEINAMLNEFNGFNLIAHNCLINSHLQWGNSLRACQLFDEMPDRNEVSWTALISGLLRLGHVDRAMAYFDRNPYVNNVFSWTATINGLVQNELNFQATNLFKTMISSGVLPNAVTFSTVITACIGSGAFVLGTTILGLIVKLGFEDNLCVSNSLVKFFLQFGEYNSARRTFVGMKEKDVISWTTILGMYIDIGDLREARRIFDEMPVKNEVTWSSMIAKFDQMGYAEEATHLFQQMLRYGFKPNLSCYSSAISALGNLKALQAGRSVHSHALKTGIHHNVFIGSTLVDMYSNCGDTKTGRVVFDSLPNKNVVCWNSMVSGYSFNGELAEATAMFNQMPQRNTVSWNALISGNVAIENFAEAFVLFERMILSGEHPNESTFSSILSVCANLASLEKGKYTHAKALKLGFKNDGFVATALVDMYAKSGSIECSRKIFTRMHAKNEVVWTAMIQGLAENGYAEESLQLFEKMEKSPSVGVNELILLSVLFSCSHCGLVEKGVSIFNKMEQIYGIKPNSRHYTCVVDMLSRSGRVEEAEKFVMRMPWEGEGEAEANANAWAALLSGCKTYGDETMTGRIAGKLSETKKAGGYVLVSNIYAWGGRWREAVIARELMRRKGIKKSGGCSWIEVRNGVDRFYSQDKTHAMASQIYSALRLLHAQIRWDF